MMKLLRPALGLLLALTLAAPALGQNLTGRVTTAPPSYANASNQPFSLGLTGGIRVDCAKAQDAAYSGGDCGIPFLAVRTAVPADSSGSNGDYEPLQVKDGRLWTSAAITALPQSSYSASATFTPAASSHTAGDANGAAGTFTSIGPASGRIIVTCATLEIDGSTAEASAWRLYLYNVTPPSATADDAAWDFVSGDRSAFLGQIDLGTAALPPKGTGSTSWIETCGINKQLLLAASGNLFGYLVNLTTVTTAAVPHIVTLHAITP